VDYAVIMVVTFFSAIVFLKVIYSWGVMVNQSLVQQLTMDN